MKPIEELEELLVAELYDSLDLVRRAGTGPDYNELMGATADLLGAVLQSLLKQQVAEWSSDKWIDGSLLHEVELDNNHLAIEGVMVWGRDAKEQWTEPFYFEIALDPLQEWYKEYVFLYGDQDKTKSGFDIHPYTWNGDQRRWKYYIFSGDKSIAS